MKELRHSLDAFQQLLRREGLLARNNTFRCPFHNDTNPSAGLKLFADGVWRAHCFVCGYTEDIIGFTAKLRNTDSSTILRKDRPVPKKEVKVIKDYKALQLKGREIYPYTNPDTGNVEMVVIRYIKDDGRKGFLQFSPCPEGWTYTAPPKPWPIAMRKQIATSNTVIVVEGERCVKALVSLGFSATTSPGGAQNALSADWSPLYDKTLYLWPDNDKPGLGYVESVRNLTKDKCKIYMVRPYGEESEDVYDLIKRAGVDAKRQVQEFLDNAVEWSDSGSLQKKLLAMSNGLYNNIPMCHPLVTKLSRPLTPGAVMVLAGPAGGGKSFLMLEWLREWDRNGIKVSYLELEKDKDFHLLRALAQEAGRSELLDDAWVKEHPTETMTYFDDFRVWLDSFAKCIETPPDKLIGLEDVKKWIQDKAESGSRIICVDPISAITNKEVYVTVHELLKFAQFTARNHNCSVIFITHPNSGNNDKPSFDSIAGGQSLSRFTDAVLWLEKFDVKQVPIKTSLGISDYDINRRIHILKAKTGKEGEGHKLGYMFNPATLKFNEIGMIYKERKKKEEWE